MADGTHSDLIISKFLNLAHFMKRKLSKTRVAEKSKTDVIKSYEKIVICVSMIKTGKQYLYFKQKLQDFKSRYVGTVGSRQGT